MSNENYSAKGYGAFGAGLCALAWFFAGVDATLARRCPPGEQARLVARGALLTLLICVLFAAATYASSMLVIDQGREGFQLLLGWVEASLLGAMWSFTTLNLYRFLVSMVSPSENLGLSVSQIPRLVVFTGLALVVAASSALPVSIWLARNDIVSETTKSDRDQSRLARKAVEETYQPRLMDLYREQVNALYDFQHAAREQAQIDQARKIAKSQSPGPKTDLSLKRLEDRATKVDAELAGLTKRQDQTQEQIQSLLAEMSRQQTELVNSGRRDGFWSEAQRALENASPIYWGCTLLFWVLYAGPLCVRALSHRGPYEHLVDIQNEVTRLRHGVVANAWRVRRSQGDEHVFTHFLAPQALEQNIVAGLQARRATNSTRVAG